MSWYSEIYTWVRNYRKTHKVSGWVLSRLLNVLLLAQFVMLGLSIFVYWKFVCGHFIINNIQATCYLLIYLTFALLSVVCLLVTLLTPIARVPKRYAIRQEKCDELKAITPCVNGRFLPKESTMEQKAAQQKIFAELCAEMNILQAEWEEGGGHKYCYVCSHFKPDRTHHCGSCGRCVLRFDHHCPWINQCVNHNNYKAFVLYIVYSTFAVIWFITTSVECSIRFFVRSQWELDLIPFICIFIISIPFGVFGYYPLGEMMIFHWELITVNETTCEQAKRVNIKGDYHADYNLGRAENWRQVFGWGLWMLPFWTSSEDGIHFKVHYANVAVEQRYERVVDTVHTESDQSEVSPGM